MAIHVHTNQDLSPHDKLIKTTCPDCHENLWDPEYQAWMTVCPACGWQAPADPPIDVTVIDEFWTDNETWRDYVSQEL